MILSYWLGSRPVEASQSPISALPDIVQDSIRFREHWDQIYIPSPLPFAVHPVRTLSFALRRLIPALTLLVAVTDSIRPPLTPLK